MSADRSRGLDDIGQAYKAVVMQQGRAIIDRDFNTFQEIADDRIAANALNEIGPCGTPDNGFAISPAKVNEDERGKKLRDFNISPGVMYVGGQRFVLSHPASYLNQPDWLWPHDSDPHSSGDKSDCEREFIYMLGFENEVSGVEDPDLLDVALGGPDTTQRVRLMWRIHRTPTPAADCRAAIAHMCEIGSGSAAHTWLDEGFRLNHSDMRLEPLVLLKASFTSPPPSSDPCAPTTQGSYQYPENQLIRMQIAPPMCGQARLLWGYDNASFLYRATLDGDQTLILNRAPVDSFHCPRQGQIVEVLRAAAILGTLPGGTGSPPIVRYVAEATGYVGVVEGYSTSNNSVTLTKNLPHEYTHNPKDPKNQLFLRVWQGSEFFDPSLPNSIALTDPTNQTSPGVHVTITVPSTNTSRVLPVGAYWMIALRPSTPQVIYPERFLKAPQPPDGPRQWVCPLAIIARRGEFHVDCRKKFENLVSLTNREWGSGCTLRFKPGDESIIQRDLDRCAEFNQPIIAHFSPGKYSLKEPLRFTSKHSQLTLEACGGPVTIQADASGHIKQFREGLLVMVGAEKITLRGLSFVPAPVPDREIADFSGATSLIAIRSANCRELTLDNCRVEFPKHNAAPREFSFAAGLYLAGDCTGLQVRNSRFSSHARFTSTYTESSPKLESFAAGRDKLYFTVSNTQASIGAVNPHNHQISLYPVPTPDSEPKDIIATSEDTNDTVWFIERKPYRLAMFDAKTQEFTEFPPFDTQTYSSPNFQIGPDGHIYFIVGSSIRKINPKHPSRMATITLKAVPIKFAFSPEGEIYACSSTGTLEIVSKESKLSELPITTSLEGVDPAKIVITDIVKGGDGNIWFLAPGANVIGMVNPKDTKQTKTLLIQVPGKPVDSSPAPSTEKDPALVRATGAGTPVVTPPVVTPPVVTPPVAAPPLETQRYTGLFALAKDSLCFLEPSAGNIWTFDTTHQQFFKYTLPAPSSTRDDARVAPIPTEIVSAAENIAWVLEQQANRIVLFNHSTNKSYEFPLKGAKNNAVGLTVGPDNNIWLFENPADKKIAVMNTANRTLSELILSDADQSSFASAGILALPAYSSDNSNDPHLLVLTDASCHGNHFENLTLPFFAEGSFGNISVHHNTVTASMTGMTFRAFDYISSGPFAEVTTAFREMQVLTNQIGIYFDIPSHFRKTHAPAHRLSLDISHNRIEAHPRNTGVYGAGGLLVLLNQEGRSDGTVIISSNDVRNRPPVITSKDETPIPTVSISAINTPTTITGNVIVNVTSIGQTGDSSINYRSLWVEPDRDGKENASMIAVTGNVLVGQDNLVELKTGQASPIETWRPFNSNN
jgi:hypothetical protein